MNGPLLIDIEGTTLTESDKALFKHPAVGGMILFSRNIVSPEQVQNLINEVRSVAPQCLITVDQEGGRVQRLVSGFTNLPALGDLGTLFEKDPKKALMIARQLGWLMASEVKAIGIDLSFAPVLDLNLGRNEVIGNRAFHAKPALVAALGAAYCQGMREAGMATVGKHFPGHGYVHLDSHHALPKDDRSWDAILIDAEPFVQLLPVLTAVMPAHIVYTEFDRLPVTFSARWLQTFLRDALHYSGIIISDDLSMAGAKYYDTSEEAAIQALSAGCDLLLVCNRRDTVETLVEPVAAYTVDKVVCNDKIQRLRGEAAQFQWTSLKQSEQWQKAIEAMAYLRTHLAA